MKNPSSILITGASSGIGEALALHYARPGITLFLSGRNAARLGAVAEQCQSRGAQAHEKIVCVTDRAAMADWINDCDRSKPLDLVIANAGISGGTGGAAADEPMSQVRAIFEINVTGVFNTIEPALALMKPRKRGQLALMSSLASFSAWPGAPAYSASKSAVRVYGESLRGALQGINIEVSVICPGFIRTAMTAVNDYKMPFMLDADKAAQVIVSGLERNKARIAFPWQTYFLAGFFGMLPPGLLLKITTRLPKKPLKD